MRSASARRACALLIGMWLAALSACERDVSSVGPQLRAAPASQRLVAPISDSVMGPLSIIAQNIVLALRDSSTRLTVMRAMKTSNPALVGLDLHSCATDQVIQRVFASAQWLGGLASAAMCELATNRLGLVLYMDRDRLRAWDGHTIPIVTALDNPDKTLPAHFTGYRSATRAIDISRDSTVGGPILVVLATIHPNAYRARANDNPVVVGRPLGMPRATALPPGTHSAGQP